MTISSTQAPTNQPQLFDLVQRAYDGAWLVWIRKSLADLNMVDRQEIEGARMATFTDAEWDEYMKQPHLTEARIPVIAAIYQSRPTVDTVLALLGVKRRQPTTKTPNRPKPARPPLAQAA